MVQEIQRFAEGGKNKNHTPQTIIFFWLFMQLFYSKITRLALPSKISLKLLLSSYFYVPATPNFSFLVPA